MKRTVLTVFGLTLVSMTFWQLHSASNSMDWMIATNANYNILRLLVGGLLAAYAITPRLRNDYVRIGLRALGVVLCALALNGLLYLTYNDSRGFTMYPLDVVSILEAGIVAIIASLTVSGQTASDSDEKIKHGLPSTNIKHTPTS